MSSIRDLSLRGLLCGIEQLHISISNELQKSIDEFDLEDKFFENITDYLAQFNINIEGVVKKEKTKIGFVKIDGRSDALIGYLVFEFKRYSLLDSDLEYDRALNEQLIEQYLNKVDKKQRIHHAGILFDGKNYAKVTYDVTMEVWKVERRTFDRVALSDILNLVAGSTKKLISQEDLIKDYNINSATSKEVIAQLYHSLNESMKSNPFVQALFNEWSQNFSHIYGGVLSEARIRQDFQEIAFSVIEDEIEPGRFLFSLYTYYGLIVKIIAAEASITHLSIVQGSVLGRIMSNDDTKNELEYLEDGGFFRDVVGIENYIEGGYFSWYIYSWNPDIKTTVLDLLRSLSKYDLRSFQLEVKQSRDLLKTLYQEIIPRKIRHDLGEYYTPDWLIQLAFAKSGFSGISGRMLDPGCGSGGFLIEGIRRIRNMVESGKNPQHVLLDILYRVVGFDVNPIAVLTARTNYIIAISDLLTEKGNDPILIPVFLCDSVITPTTEGVATVTEELFYVPTVLGVIKVPRPLIDLKIMPHLLLALDQWKGEPVSIFVEEICNNEALSKYKSQISQFLDNLRTLPENVRHIWARILLNSFAPLFQGQFDYVIGNPPWIKWEFLSKDYKDKLSKIYLKIYKLYSYGGMKAGLGFAHDDISIVFTYVTADKYLKDKGTLAFILKQTLYKSVAGREFRKFGIEKSTKLIPLKVQEVIDLLDIAPFESAGSETSLIVITKGEETKYPVSYEVWEKRKGFPIRGNELLEEIIGKVNCINKKAKPDPEKNDILAPWIIFEQDANVVSLGGNKSYYPARHGIVNDLINVFFINIKQKRPDGSVLIENESKGGKKKVKPFEGCIECEFIYPIIKPQHAKKWGISGYKYMIVPQQKAGENNSKELSTKYPQTYNYLKHYEEELCGRSSRWFKGEGKPFYSIFGIGEYTFTPYRVVWCAMSFQPAFSVVSDCEDINVGKKPILPDNTIGYIPAGNELEAHFICGVMNSRPVEAYFRSRSNKSKWGISIDMVNCVPIPKFSLENPLHLKIAELSKNLHEMSATSAEGSAQWEAELDAAVSELFSITKSSNIERVEIKSHTTFSPIPVPLPEVGMMDKLVKQIPFNVLDLETTGFSPYRGDRIVEIWVGKYVGGVNVSQFHVLLDPCCPIPSVVTKITGIEQKMVDECGKFDTIVKDLLDFLGDDPVVVHNAQFELSFINSEIRACGLTTPSNPVIDVLLLARRQFSFEKNSLVHIASEIKCTTTPKHRALEDASATAEILYWMIEKFESSLENLTLSQLLKLQGEYLMLNRVR